MHDDPLRAQSLALAAGAVLATLVVVAGAVLGLVRGGGLPPSAPIVIAEGTGALYVRVNDAWHPVLNLASARLISRTAANPVAADEASIAAAKRGPLIGIPGAPATIGAPLAGQAWTVCDDDRTAVVVGPSDGDQADTSRPVLVTPRGEVIATTYLLYDGQRAAVDLRNPSVVRALRLDGVVPVAVSRLLLDVVPETPPIAPPSIAGAGRPGPAGLDGATVGTVVSIQRVDAVERYVVLREGLQRVGDVAADLIGFTYGRARDLPVVAPAAIAALPIADTLPVGTFPQRARIPIGAKDGHAVCARWLPGSPARMSNTVVYVTDSGSANMPGFTALAQADGAGPAVDGVVLPGGRSAFVRSSRILGRDDETAPRFLVTDAGVVFGVHDDDSAHFLGLVQPAEPAPWPILSHLPHGPELSVEAASVIRDGFAAVP
jgi:type VII secretion protein EccB